MKVRSGFKKNKSKNKSAKTVFSLFTKQLKKLLSFNIFTFKYLLRFKKSKPRKNPKSYLSRDVHIKNFNNPYQKKRKSPLKIFRIIAGRRESIAYFALFLVFIIWFTVVFLQPTFYIKNISISGNEEINTEDLTAIVDGHLSSRNILLIKKSHRMFLDLNDLEKVIRDRYGLESIEFIPHWPSNSLSIKVKEKLSVLAYSVDDQYFTIDRQGMIIRSVENFEELSDNQETPIIYQYDNQDQINIGDYILSSESIETIMNLHQQLSKYDSFNIHSYRLKNLEKNEIKIRNKHPDDQKSYYEKVDYSADLDQLAESIATAGTLDEKIASIKETLNEIDIERLEEGSVERLYDTELVFTPDDNVQIQELEVYMKQGWSLKLGHTILEEPESLNDILSIFTTLSHSISIEGEVNEYIDLRFSGRIYYR